MKHSTSEPVRSAYLLAWPLAILALVLVPLSPTQATPDAISLDLDLPSLSLNISAGDTAVFDAQDVQWLSPSGRPAIPYKVLHVLVPPGADLSTVQVDIEPAYTSFGRPMDIEPTPPIATLVNGQQVVVWPENARIADGRDLDVYDTDDFWPQDDLEILSVGKLRQYQLVEIAVPLIKYNPVARQTRTLTQANLTVAFDDQGYSRRVRAFSQADTLGKDRLAQLVANAGDIALAYDPCSVETPVAATAAQSAAAPTNLGYAIVTTNSIKEASDALADFIAHKQAMGFDVYVVTEDHFGGGTGDTAANNIRDYLQANYDSLGLQYVLLLGNPHPTSGDIPNKICIDNQATDFFYADLSGNWDNDGDGTYGEWGHDTTTGGIDRYYEVLVGRIPYYGDIAAVDGILQHAIDYQQKHATSNAWRRNALLPMKPLDGSTPAYGLGENIKNSFLNPYGWGYYRLYDSNYGLNPAPEATPCSTSGVTAAWKSDPYYGLVVWLTHGNYNLAASVTDTGQVPQLDDDHPSMVYQGSCLNAQPEYSNNLSYILLKDKAVAATISATRLSWYYVGQNSFTNTTSIGGFAYQYAQRLIADEMPCAQAFYDLKQDLGPGIWKNFLVMNLYGDPSIGFFHFCKPFDGFEYHAAQGQAIEAPIAKTYTVTNGTNDYFDWSVTKTAACLEVFPDHGILQPDRDIDVHVVLAATPDMGCYEYLPGQTLNVPDDYATVQAAIDAANEADTIVVATGTYNENINFNGKNITLTSSDPDDPATVAATVLQGDATTSVVTFAGNETSATALIGFTITGGSSYVGGGILGNGANANISRCVITDNSASWAAGIAQSHGTIDRCTVSHNQATYNGGGIGGCHGQILSCLVSDNLAGGFGGGLVDCDADIANCTFAYNIAEDDDVPEETGGAIKFCDGTVTNCIMSGNSGWQVADSQCVITYTLYGGPEEDGNINGDPLFVDSASGNYRLQASSPCVDVATTQPPAVLPETDIDGASRWIDDYAALGTACDMGALELDQGATLHVPAQYPTIQQALDAANSGDTILVAPGTYNENIAFDGKNLHLTSLDPDDPDTVAATIIQGDGSTSVVTFSGSEKASCRLAGFTITGGGNTVSSGGVRGNTCTATISRCTITGNVATYGGGLGGCNGLIERCTISGNIADAYGGGFAGCHGTIANCLVIENTAGTHGGGINNCDGNIVNCTVARNVALDTDVPAETGGGFNMCDGNITNCIIWQNSDWQVTDSSALISYTLWGGASDPGNINADPLFVDPDNGDYSLQSDSPCINAAIADSQLVANTDLLGNPRGGVVNPLAALHQDTLEFFRDGDLHKTRPITLNIYHPMIGHWQLDGNATDDAPYDFNGATHGSPAWTSQGILGSALDLDGVDDYVTLPVDIFDPSKPFSFFAWVKIDDVTLAQPQILLQQEGENGRGLLYRDVTEPAVLFSYLGSQVNQATATPFDQAGKWRLIGITYDDQQNLTFYIDGLRDETVHVNGEPEQSPLRLGAWKFDDKFWKGKVDDVRLYSCALTDAQVAALSVQATGVPICLEPPAADLNQDCRVDILDLNTLLLSWPDTYDFDDFARLANHWLACTLITTDYCP